MTSRMKFSDVRWFSDKRPVCIIEYEKMKELGARNEFEYASLLQKNGIKIFDEVRKTPKLSVGLK
jgi:hypothetical protein